MIDSAHRLHLPRLVGGRERAWRMAQEVPAEVKVIVVEGREATEVSAAFADELVVAILANRPDRYLMFAFCPPAMIAHTKRSAAIRGLEEQCAETDERVTA